MKYIGLDFGSVFFKGVVIGENGIELHVYEKDAGARESVVSFLEQVKGQYPGEEFKTGICGLSEDLSIKDIQGANEIIALSQGVVYLNPEAKSIIEIGAQTSKFVLLDNGAVSEFYTNELCAAGTGSFIEQQAGRLKLSLQELTELTLKAEKAAKIAGRCSVFAKTDMIHLQQKGTPTEEIAYGLCVAIARNSFVSLLKGREVSYPLVIAGGCARNAGIIRAFREILNHKKDKIIPSGLPGLEVAIGAALIAANSNVLPLSVDDIKHNVIEAIRKTKGQSFRYRKRLTKSIRERETEPQTVFHEEKEGYIGIDVGSVSTDFAVIDKEGNVISAVYLATRGKPVEVILEGLSILKKRFRGGLKVLGCGVTGSGRYLAQKLVGADVVKNEITCQILGAKKYFEDVDTIFEIGGQDSKYVYLKDGGMEDFTMNKICAAGTGSFLEEQSAQMGINIFKDFAELAFKSEKPLHLSSRCTVFMESEVAKALKSGLAKEDICAGLAYAIAENYLEKVVENRKIGEKIVFQGGVASNNAVVSAFESILDKKIKVHPYNRISGAIGAAIAAKLYKKEGSSSFKGFDIKVEKEIRTFECKACPNYCEVSMIKIDGEKVFFGDACERFSSKKVHKIQELPPNLAEEYINYCENYFKEENGTKGKIGIPRASTLIGYLPFWATFFKELGFQPVLSDYSSEAILLKGVKNLPVGACLPIKLTAGHVVSLLEKGVDYVFIPAVITLPGDSVERSFGCPYTQSVPFMIKLSPENFIAPVISLAEGKESFVKRFERYMPILDINKKEIELAYERAFDEQKSFERKLKEIGRELFFSTKYPKFAVLGRPYNLFDFYLNLNLFSHLRKLPSTAIPINYLPIDFEKEGSELPWKFSADIVKAAKKLTEYEDVYPIIVSNFGCGPDAFAAKYLDEVLKNKPYLFLEFDEHRGEAGLITRLEAFMDRVESKRKTQRKSIYFVHKKEEKINYTELKEKKIYMPYFADHVYAFSGALKFMGYNVEVLPLPDEETSKLGEAAASGKECHAYAEILGDLVKLSKMEKEDVIFLFPGTKMPCLLNQYGNGMNIFLRSQGIKNIRVFTPLSEDFMAMLNMEALERFYKGVLSIDLMVKASCQVRPYEIEKGMTDKIHEENLLEMERAIQGGDIVITLSKALERLNKIKREVSERRPVVGIAGDIYTRINPNANNDLFHYLEQKGLEVWPSPFEIDILDFGLFKSFEENLSRRNLPGILESGGILIKRAVELWKIRRAISGKIERFKEPGYREVLELASPYIWNEKNELLLLNIAKIVDFARNGVDGVINAICFNCMVGNASAAIIEKIKKDYRGLPIITLVYSGGEHPTLKTTLNAFIEQVKTRNRTSGYMASSSASLKIPLLSKLHISSSHFK